MMTNVIAGHDLGLGDTSLRLLKRNDQTAAGSLNQNQQTYVNAANGNLIVQEQDVLLPSQGADFQLLRTYNSRGRLGGGNLGWTWSTGIGLTKYQAKLATGTATVDAYQIVYGDGSSRNFDYDATRKLWVSIDGSRAYETLQVLADKTYKVTRADQSIVNFDKTFTLTSLVDTNGVRMDFVYSGGRLTTIKDDTGYTITFNYTGANLGSIVNQNGDVLVQYAWTSGLLTSVIDRFGHVTQYSYDQNKLLSEITLPNQQTVGNQLQVFEQRKIQFNYQSVTWNDKPAIPSTLENSSLALAAGGVSSGLTATTTTTTTTSSPTSFALSEVIDPSGAKTSFEYNFRFAPTLAADDKDIIYKNTGNSYLQGGTTRVIDALGNARAYSNDAEYVTWRQANGFYTNYDANAVAASATLKAQVAAIRNAQSIAYDFDADGYLTKVTDEQGFQTIYTWDSKNNLTSIIDRNAYGAMNSDSSYFRGLRKDLGYVDGLGNGKLASGLSNTEKTALLNLFTSRYSYDSNGNVLSFTDNAGNQTTWTYTTFNKVATETSAVGNALISKDDNVARQKRLDLGYPGPLASVTAAQKTAIKALYTSSYQYDSKQNLITKTEAGGDITKYEYDLNGNLTRQIVFTDKNDLTTISKQQITRYGYDAYGNNTSIIDAEGFTTTYQYDSFGNLLRTVNAKGGVTTYTYDKDNRLLTATDPEGQTTAYAYDAVGNTIATTDANGHTIIRIYDRANRLIGVLDPSLAGTDQDRKTQFKYDVLGNQTQIIDAEGRISTYQFDTRRQQIALTTALVTKVDAGGNESLTSYTSRWSYDGENNVVTQTDNNGNLTQMLYTTHNLLKRLTDALGNINEYLYDANLNRLQVTLGAQLPAAQQRVLKFAYDQQDRKIRDTDALGGQTLYSYDGADNVITVTDANGRVTNFEYDRNNRLLREIRPQVIDPRIGLATRYTMLHQYDANGNEITSTDENGNVTRTSFDKNDRRVMIEDANGIKTVFSYDSRNNTTQIAIGVQTALDANGKVLITNTDNAQVTTFVYDEFKQLIAKTDGVGNALLSSDLQLYQKMRLAMGLAPLVANLTEAQRAQIKRLYTERYSYDRVGNLIQTLDHLGRINRNNYDALNRVVQTIEAVGLTEQRVSEWRYDGNDNVVKYKDANARITRTIYDAMDRQISITDPTNSVTHYRYDNVGNRIEVKEGVGSSAERTSSWIYDLNNRITKTITAAGRLMSYEYDAVGNRLKEIDGRGNATRYVYDGLNRLVKLIDPTNFETRYEYDGVGNQLTQVDARGSITRFKYDAGNRQIEMTDAEARVSRFSYDALGRTITQTTAAGTVNEQITQYQYDAQGNLRQIQDAQGIRSYKDYDANYNLIQVTDGNGNVTQYGFDALNRQIQVIDALGQVTRYTYDALENQLSQTDALGRTRSYQYDGDDRLIVATDAQGVQTQYRYDAVGNQISITYAANNALQARTQSYQYDNDGLLLQETDALGAVKFYQYDANKNVTAVTDANGNITRYAYDANNRVDTITDPLGNVMRYVYDGNGNRIKTSDANGNSWITYYNKDNQADLTIDPLGFAKIRKYDANGNIIEETQIMTAFTGVIDLAVRPNLTINAALDQTVRYQYDKLNRISVRIDPLANTYSYRYDANGNLVSETNENGNTITYLYDRENRLISKTNALGAVKSFSYDALGNVMTEIDENGNTISSVYDLENRLIRSTDALGGAMQYSYDAVGNLISQTDQNGHTVQYVYNKNSWLLQQIDARGGVTNYQYDAVGNQIQLTDANGTIRSTSYYDKNNRLVLNVDALGFVNTLDYDAAGNLVKQTQYMTALSLPVDPNQKPILIANSADQIIQYQYNQRNQLRNEIDARGGVIQYQYDAVGNRTRIIDARGNAKNYRYDADNRLIETKDALNQITSYSYDAVGNQVSMTDARGNSTSYRYDANNQLTQIKDGLNQITSYSYDAVGNTVSMTDARGNSTSYRYDANNQLIQTKDALNQITSYTYDAVGNKVSMTDARGNSTSYRYDANNQLIQTKDALNQITSYSYDAVGNKISMTDARGNSTSYRYDANNQLVQIKDALNQITSYSYDAVGNTVSMTDARGNSTSYRFDANNQLIQIKDALNQITSYSYDAVGNKVSMTDARGNSTSYRYDANNQLVQIKDALNQITSYSYDAVGNKLSMTDARGASTSYAYDANNQLLTMTDALGYSTAYRYDANGNVTETRQQLSLTDTSQVIITRNYWDAVNQLLASRSGQGYLTSYQYDAVGNRIAKSVFDDAMATTANINDVIAGNAKRRTTTYVYDALDQLTEEHSSLGIITAYEYDAVGNRTTKLEAKGTSHVRRTEIHYDAVNRISDTLDALGIVTHTTRDAVGNALSIIEDYDLVTQTGKRSSSFEYNAINQVTKQIDALGYVTQLSYDAVGNLIQRNSAVGLTNARTEKFEYDANQRQTAQINGENERTEYQYDAVGNRIKIVIAPGAAEQRTKSFRYDLDNRLIAEVDGNGIETQYQYDGAGNKTKTIQLAAAYDSSGNAVAIYQGKSIVGKQRETRFSYDLDNRLIAVTDPMAGVTNYQLDVLGNRVQITDANGHQTKNSFDAEGRLVTNLQVGADHGGVLVSNVYDDFGNIIQSRRGFVDNTDVRQTSYTYDAKNQQTSITEYDKIATLTEASVFAQSYSTVFKYDAFGNQISVSHGEYLLTATDAGYDADKAAQVAALSGTFSYDALDHLIQSKDGVGNILAYSYDAYGNRSQQTSGYGTTDARSISFTYDKADRMVRRETEAGAIIKIAYDKAGNQISQSTLQSGNEAGSAASNDAPVWSNETFQVDGNGRVIQESNAMGIATKHIIDAFGNEIETRQAAATTDERIKRYEYNANNNLLAEVDALGNRTQYQVDAVGNRISETDALGYTSYLYYNERNQQIAALDPEGYLVGFDRDSMGNVLTIKTYLQKYTSAASNVIPTPNATDIPYTNTNVYDGAGNLIQQTGADQRKKTYRYDSAGKLNKITDYGNSANATARVQSFSYDKAGRKITYTRADGVVESYAYDTANNRTQESITVYAAGSTTEVAQLRKTDISYDKDNRQTVQKFDPDGLSLLESLSYDKAGNVISKTDARGNVTKMTYDLANRVLSVTDALNNQQSFTYDRVGNRTSVTDARGQTSYIQYDLNNRAIKEIQPSVSIYTIRDGLQTAVNPTTQTIYDAIGNVVQTIDANGSKTRLWYDGNRRQVAELNADNVLRRFSYDANGLLTSASLYMSRLTAAAHDPDTLPTALSGEVRTITNTYDTAERLIKTQYPQITVSSLSNLNSNTPTETTSNLQPEETVAYDAFGNRAKAVNRNGQAVWNWYDSQDRVIASVDEAGYLTEFKYDDQGNQVQQTQYSIALNLATLSIDSKPTAPSTGSAYTIDRSYDLANRLVSESTPTVSIHNGTSLVSERILTQFEYDANGNLVRKRLAAGTSSEVSEYYYYDAANRQIAIVNANKVLHTMSYDANGNKTAFKRYLTPLTLTATELSAATLSALLAAVTSNASADQQSLYSYDAANRQISSSDQMGTGTADDITISTAYDAVGKQTKRVDPDGYVTQTAYDALGHVTQTVSPDGNRSFIEYDAAGLQTLAWTGDLGSNTAVAASGITAKITDKLNISWNTSSTKNFVTYVVWDTVAHDKPSDYSKTSARQGSGDVSTAISLTGISAGSLIYFRVVSVDAAGSMAWTAENSVTVPTMMSSISIAQSASNLDIIATFNGTISNPQLKYGTAAATLTSTINFVQQGSTNTWKATISNPSNGGQGLFYQVNWTANAQQYATTTTAAFEASGTHDVSGTTNQWTVSWPIPKAAQGDTQLVLLNGVRNDAAFQVNGQIQFNPGTLTNGTTLAYQVFYGNAQSTAHSASVSWNQNQKQDYTLQNYNYASDGTTVLSTVWNVNWINDGNLTTTISTTLNSAETAKVGAAGVKVAYRTAGSGSSFSSEANLTKSTNTFSADLSLTPGQKYDLKIFYIDSNGKEVIIEWRTVTVPAQATSPVAASPASTTVTGKDIKPSPIPTRSVAVATAQNYNGNSLLVLAKELDGSITRNGSNLTVNPGLYIGEINIKDLNFALSLTTTSSAGADSQKASGLTTSSYFTESQYDALGNKIATNENNGLWRRFAVDAMGRALKTRVYGTKADESSGKTPITTYAAYDARGLEIARYAALVNNDDDGNGVEETTQKRAVTRFTYDYAQRKISQIDPGNTSSNAQSFEYDALGQLISQTDALGNKTTINYDRRGHEVRRIDALNHTQKFEYDLAGRKTKESNALGNNTLYSYDAFDRLTQISDALANNTKMEYDQHDRLVKVSDALNNTTEYLYDKRDQRLWTKDNNGNYWGQAYDAMRRIIASYSFSGAQGSAPTSFANAIDALSNTANAANATLLTEKIEYDVYGNKTKETDAENRTKIYSYGVFGRLQTQTDEAARITTFSYDRFGRMTTETRADDDTTEGAKNITRSYDDAGRLKSVTDTTTQVSTQYTYTVAGNRAHETVSAPGLSTSAAVSTVRNIQYSWDAKGQMTSWSDTSTSQNLSYSYDAAGNLIRVKNTDSTVDHNYSYDAANRLLSKKQGTGSSATTLEAYTYDAAGNRKTYNDATNTTTFTYDVLNRVTQADVSPNATSSTSGDETQAKWTYDKVGNITKYEELDKNKSVVYTQTTTFSQNYRTLTSATNNQRDASNKSITSTVNTLDKTGRLLKEVTTDTSTSDTKVYTYTHSYTQDGRELSVTATGTGSLTGSSKSTYDANDKLSRIDLGKPDGSGNTDAYKLFRYSSDGQILTSFYDDGIAANKDVTTEYLYANSNIVGQKGNSTSSDTVTTVLDADNYNLVKNMDSGYPAATVSHYQIQAGDSLQSIASKLFGNPSLWFVIADVNNLASNEDLKPGMQITIPNSTQMGRITADTHVVYNESQIVGSKLPTLNAPPPPEPDKCAQAAAIVLTILVSIIAVVATVLTAGALAPLAAAAVGVTATSAVGIIIGATVGAVVGATFGLVSGAINQGIKIGLKVQSEFNWKEVGAEVAAGAIGGVGAAFSGAAQIAIKSAVTAAKLTTTSARIARVATVALDAAFNVAGEASSQAITYGGRIEEPWMLGVAGGGAILGEGIRLLGSRALRAIRGDKASAILENTHTSKKIVRFADNTDTITSTAINDIGVANNKSIATVLRSSDVKLDLDVNTGKTQLQIKFAGDALNTNQRTSGFTPISWSDTAAVTLSRVQSQSTLDQVADPEIVLSTKKILAGQTADFDNNTITDFAQGSVGHVRDNTIPLPELSMSRSVDLKLSQNGNHLANQWQADIDRVEIEMPIVANRLDIRNTEPARLLRTTSAPAQLERSIPIDTAPQLESVNKLGVSVDRLQTPATEFLSAPAVTLQRTRAYASGTQNLPEAALDLRRGINKSVINPKPINTDYGTITLDSGVKYLSRSAKKELKKYFANLNQPFAQSAAERKLQMVELENNLTKALSNKHVGALARDQYALLKETINDSAIMKSPYVLNPSHALELKRLGLQPSGAGQVGQFTDVQLAGAMKELGSGNLNTVYLGKYVFPNGDSFDGVFKQEVRELNRSTDVVPVAGDIVGIDIANPRFGYRNVATTRLDEMLGFDITTRSEMAIHNGKLGTVSEKAMGISPKGSKVSTEKLSDQRVADYAEAFEVGVDLKTGRAIRDRDWIENYNIDRTDDSAEIARLKVNGVEEYHFVKANAREVNYQDPALRRGLVRLQLEDAIAGQVDRHYGNYFVLQDANNKVISVKGIDNDLSWGKNMKQVEIKSDVIHLPNYLPRVVDRESYNSVMVLNREKLMQRLGGLLTKDEINAAATRLQLVQTHLKTLNTKGRVLNTLDDWRGDNVADLLTRVKKDGGHTSYVSRDVAISEHKRQQNLLVAYPRSALAN